MSKRRLGLEWISTAPPKIYDPDLDGGLPSQVTRIGCKSVRGIGALGEAGRTRMLEWLQAATEMGHIDSDLWNKALDSAFRQERDDIRRGDAP